MSDLRRTLAVLLGLALTTYLIYIGFVVFDDTMPGGLRIALVLTAWPIIR